MCGAVPAGWVPTSGLWQARRRELSRAGDKLGCAVLLSFDGLAYDELDFARGSSRSPCAGGAASAFFSSGACFASGAGFALFAWRTFVPSGSLDRFQEQSGDFARAGHRTVGARNFLAPDPACEFVTWSGLSHRQDDFAFWFICAFNG